MAGVFAPSAFLDDRIPARRVKGEGELIYKKHREGTIQNIMLEVEGTSYFGNQTTPSYKKPKDHIFENVRRMRQIQKACRARVEESTTKEPEPVKALWRSAKYATVPSKVAQFLTTNYNRPASARPAAGVTSDAKSNATAGDAAAKGGQMAPRRPQSARLPSNRPEIVPPLENIEEQDLVVNGKKIPRSFIYQNAVAAIHAPLRRSPSAVTLHETQQRLEDEFKQKYNRGQVPEYLIERQKQWKTEEEERVRNLPDPEQPPGHRLLPEGERKEILDKLQSRERDLTSQLLHLPLRVDTPRLVKYKNDIETQLSQVDEAIRVFSRRKVFVKSD